LTQLVGHKHFVGWESKAPADFGVGVVVIDSELAADPIDHVARLVAGKAPESPVPKIRIFEEQIEMEIIGIKRTAIVATVETALIQAEPDCHRENCEIGG
jgi:hypothetical protein